MPETEIDATYEWEKMDLEGAQQALMDLYDLGRCDAETEALEQHVLDLRAKNESPGPAPAA